MGWRQSDRSFSLAPATSADEVDRFRYYPSLDGLRAISILMVLGFHKLGPISERLSGVVSGWAGVDIFFLISGFLITSLLVDEQREFGSFNIRRFYLRRCVRIWPAYYVFLVTVLMSGWADPKSVAVGAVYLTDYDLALGWGITAPHLHHLWSLAIEEQFYLFWPLALALAGRRAVPLALGLIICVWVWRLGLLFADVPWIRLTGALDTRLDGLMVGCLAGLAWGNSSIRARIRICMSGSWVPLLAVAGLFAVAQTLGHPSDPALQTRFLFWAIRMPMFELLGAVLILALLVHPRSVVSRVLSYRGLVWVGRLSYSLYLWHLVAFFHLWPTVQEYLPVSVAASPVVYELVRLLLCVFVAAASYYMVERPFLTLKKRWGTSRGHRVKPNHSVVNLERTGVLSPPGAIGAATSADRGTAEAVKDPLVPAY